MHASYYLNIMSISCHICQHISCGPHVYDKGMPQLVQIQTKNALVAASHGYIFGGSCEPTHMLNNVMSTSCFIYIYIYIYKNNIKPLLMALDGPHEPLSVNTLWERGNYYIRAYLPGEGT